MTTPLVTFGQCQASSWEQESFNGHQTGYNVRLCMYPNSAPYTYCFDEEDDGYFPYSGNSYQLQFVPLWDDVAEGVHEEAEDENDDPGSWGRDDDDSYDDYEAEQEAEDIYSFNREFLLYDSH